MLNNAPYLIINEDQHKLLTGKNIGIGFELDTHGWAKAKAQIFFARLQSSDSAGLQYVIFDLDKTVSLGPSTVVPIRLLQM
jgi:hypothetical protein